MATQKSMFKAGACALPVATGLPFSSGCTSTETAAAAALPGPKMVRRAAVAAGDQADA